MTKVKSKTIYVVEGSTGEYSDHNEWLVAAFLEESDAKEYVLLCTQAVPDIEDMNDDQREQAKNPYDPRMQIDYTGVRYRYSTVVLHNKVPEL
jgi:hypothetical protein